MTDGYTVAHLLPRDTPRQRVAESVVNVTPEPSERDEHVDAFGNRVTQFGVHHPHDELVVEAVSTVDVDDPMPIDDVESWNDVAARVDRLRGDEAIEVGPFRARTRFVDRRPRRRRPGRHRLPLVHTRPGDRRGRQRPVPPDLRPSSRTTRRRPTSRARSPTSSRHGAACARTSPTWPPGVCARSASRRDMSAATSRPTPPAGSRSPRRRRCVARVVLDLDTVGGLDRLRSDERPLPDPPPRHGRMGT